jgi:TonB family protein
MSVTASMALHLGGFLLFLHVAQLGTKARSVDIQNVDIIRVFRPAPAQLPRAKAPPPTMKDFLKMALPSVRKAEPRTMPVKLPEIRRPLLPATPKLEENRLRKLAKVEALDLAKRRVDAAQISAQVAERRAAALAALPRLEEVGRRQVRNLPSAIKLEEQRQEAVALQAIASQPVLAPRRGLAPVAVLQEPTPQQEGGLEKAITSFLPAAREPARLEPRAAEPPPLAKRISAAPPSVPKRTADIQQEKRKAVEIEGPLADRRVVSYDVPAFPEWARQRNIIEAEVVILFYVDPEGAVLPDLRVERTSGYGRLDRLCLDSLRRWKFAPISASVRQWGRITFRFILE